MSVKAESGPDHRKRFLVEVRIAEETVLAKALARGVGSTKNGQSRKRRGAAFEKLRKQVAAAVTVLGRRRTLD